jgi:hypothetical protein
MTSSLRQSQVVFDIFTNRVFITYKFRQIITKKNWLDIFPRSYTRKTIKGTSQLTVYLNTRLSFTEHIVDNS